MKRIAILFGGTSSEHEVSCTSAVSIKKNIDATRYECIMIGVSKSGKWFLTNATNKQISDSSWIERDDNLEVTFALSKDVPCIYTINGNIVEMVKIDCVFSVLHGKYGEDGAAQGMLELSGIPYVGSGVETSAIAFDKAMTKRVVESLNINQAKCIVIEERGNLSIDEYCIRIIEYFKNKYPIFVKPAREGSSMGITKVKAKEELYEAIRIGFEHDTKLVVEEGIIGREIEIAVLGTLCPKVSGIGEILTKEDFYSYDAKYSSLNSETKVADDIPSKIVKNLRDAVLQIYIALECKGLARVDFFLKENGEYVFNEINTLPGFTPISMYPTLWQNEGITYSELITALIEDAININNYKQL